MVIRSLCQPLGGCKGGSIPVAYTGTSSSLVRRISIARAPRLRPTPEKKMAWDWQPDHHCHTVLSEVDDGAGQAGREGEGANGGKGAASAAASAAAVPVLQLLRPVRMRKMGAKAWNKTYMGYHLSPSALLTQLLWLHLKTG